MGSSIRREYVHQILERQDFFLFTPILNDHHARCVSLVDRFPRPRRTYADRAAALQRARALGPLATGAGESVRTDDDSSVTASPNALRNQPLVQSHDVRASRCVYTRAVEVALAAIFELYNGVSSTHNVESLYPPNVWNHKLVCMYWLITKSRGEGLFMNMNKFSYISNSSFLRFWLGSTWSCYRFLYFGRGEAWRLSVLEVPPRIVLIVLRFWHSFYDSTLFTLVETFAHGPFLISFGV